MPILNNRSIKSPHKYYKGVRIIKKATISVMTFLLSIPLFMWTPLANPKNVYNTPYGTYTTDYQLVNDDQYGEIQIGPFVIYAVDKNVSTFKYQFNNYYTGTITINTFTNINPVNDLAAWRPELFTDNCTVLSYTDSSVTFYIKNVKEFSATLVYPTGKTQFNIQAWANPGTTNITAQTDTQSAVNQILSYVQFINEDSFSIAADMRTVKNKLLDSLGYGSSDDTIESDFDTLHTEMSNLISAINSVGTKIDVLHGDLQTINNTLNNADNIQWSVFSNFKGMTNDYNTYDLTSQTYTSRYCPCYEPVFFNQNNWKGIFKIVLNVSGYRNMNLWVKRYGSYINIDNAVIYKEINADNVIYYVKLDDDNWFNEYAQFYFDVNNDYFFFGGSDNKIYFIDYNNIDYWRLMEYFGLIQQNQIIEEWGNSIVNAINNMSINVNSLTVNATGITYNTNQTDVTNSITNYNTNINQVYNVENNLESNFNQYNQQFNPDFTGSLTALQDTSTMMNGIITQINGIQLFTVPILLTLAGIVLLAILG